MWKLIIIVIISVILTESVNCTSKTGNLLRQARQVVVPITSQLNQGPPLPPLPKDRSIYARRASAVADVVSDVYEVFVGPSNFSYTKNAIVVLRPDNNSGVNGILYLTQEGNHAPVRINGTITGLTPGKHGFHVHQSGNTVEGCKSTGGHFNPFMQPHGAPTDDKRHIGDLGNIEADNNGVATIQIEDAKISITGTATIVGRAFVVHEKEDDLGTGGNEGSTKTGNAGGRLACGVVGVL